MDGKAQCCRRAYSIQSTGDPLSTALVSRGDDERFGRILGHARLKDLVCLVLQFERGWSVSPTGSCFGSLVSNVALLRAGGTPDGEVGGSLLRTLPSEVSSENKGLSSCAAFLSHL